MCAKPKRLGKEDWLLAGLRGLTTGGDTALAVEPLAREIGSTKGSFYWHFSDLPGFERALFAYWEQEALRVPIAEVEAAYQGPVARLLAMTEIAAKGASAAHGGAGAEPALRSYARVRPWAGEAVARVDTARLAWLEQMMKEARVANPVRAARGLYAAYLGLDHLTVAPEEAVATLQDLVRILTASCAQQAP